MSSPAAESEAVQPSLTKHRANTRQRLILWCVLMTVCFLVGGSPPPDVNETHYLTKARHYWDPSFCPGDPFLDSSDPHLAFYWSVGWLAAVMPLSPAAWIGRLAAWALISWGWLRLGEALFGAADWDSPPLQGGARGGSADGTIDEGAGRQRGSVDERLHRPLPAREGSRAVAGLATALSFTLWLVLIEYANFAGEWVVGGVEGKCFAYGFVLCGLAALLRGQWNRAWIHFGVAAAFHVLVGGWTVLAAGAVWASSPRGRRPSLLTMAPGLVAGGAIACLGLAPALWLERGVPAETAAEAARIYVFDRLPHHLAPLQLKNEELLRRAVRFGALMIALFLVVGGTRSQRQAQLNRFAIASLLFFALGLAINWTLGDDQLAAARWLRYYWFRLTDVAVPLAAAAGVSAGAVRWLQTPGPWRKLGGAVPLAFCAWALLSTTASRWQQPGPRAVFRSQPELRADWLDACAWIDANAPPDALFLVPKHAQSFKWYAHRGDAGNWKDVPQDAAAVVAWRQRMGDLYPVAISADGTRLAHNSPAELAVDQVRELAEAYGATHLIDLREPALPLPILYANGRLAVYDLTRGAAK